MRVGIPSPTVLVVGAGVFGLSAARALNRRGARVTVFDPGPVPHPLAASTDISKAIRFDYGNDVDYMAWMEQAMHGWRDYNQSSRPSSEPPLFHETGLLYLSRDALRPGGFEYELPPHADTRPSPGSCLPPISAAAFLPGMPTPSRLATTIPRAVTPSQVASSARSCGGPQPRA